ncbi:MAG: LysR family transcriptional regulator [Candidatus Thiodiazotropha sp.]
MIELNHLRFIAALEQHGTLTAATSALFLSQSALSHQIGCLEKRLGVDVWQREGRRLRLTRAGRFFIEFGHEILPIVELTEDALKALAEGKLAMLRIGVECYPCYEWLKGVITEYLSQEPGVDVDIYHRFQFSGLEGLLNRKIDLLITPDRVEQTVLDFKAVLEYELMLLVSVSHPLAGESWIEPKQLTKDILITFPVAAERLDILNLLLWPAAVTCVKQKRIESFEIILQLVANNRGICAIPNWLAAKVCNELPLRALRLGRSGIKRKLYVGYRQEDIEIDYLQRFLRLAEGFMPGE